MNLFTYSLNSRLGFQHNKKIKKGDIMENEIKDWQKEDLKYIWHPCSQMKDYETLPPIVIERGQGINLYDTNGKCYKESGKGTRTELNLTTCHS